MINSKPFSAFHILQASSETVATYLASDEKAIDLIEKVWPLIVLMSWNPLLTLQILQVVSRDPVAKYLPSGEKAA